jgi:GT2 family glycosyltransferase/glycosyltransferase involved in cell wall biosynthesis/predicted Zn-dependent protease
LNIIAIISAHNEGDIIYHVIGDLISNGVSVYLIDNQSTDNTIQEASRWVGGGLIHIERFPEDLGFPLDYAGEYRWREILLRKEQLAIQLGADWYIHADADEFRESPWDKMTLHDAIRHVDKAGYNAIDFELLNFRPVDNSFVPGEDVRESLTGFEWGEDFNSLQIKAWKFTGVRVDLASHGGHNVMFPGRKIFPQRFILRHYPIRSQEHGLRKVFQDRKKRFTQAERVAGWHIQYDHISKDSYQFLHAPDTLITYDGTVVRQTLHIRPLVVAVYSLDLPDQACSRIRFGGVGDQLRTTIDIRWGSRFDPSTKQFHFDLALGRRADLIVIARFFPSPQTWNVVEEFLEFGKPVIYDVDDLLTNLDDSSPFKGFADSCAPFIENIARRAHLVTVSNAELKREMAAFTSKIQVLPNLIDGNLWTMYSQSVSISPRVVIGYAGGFTHKKDLEIVETALEIISQKYRDSITLVFMGCATDRIATLPGFTYLDEVMDYACYAEKLQTSGIGIALAPLVDTRFNRCKSNIKWLEYSACGCAGIFSDLPPYNSCIQNGLTGLLVENTTESWVNAIEQLISDPELRRSIAENAKQQVMANHTLLSGAHKYMEAYSSLITIEEPVQNSNSTPKVNEVVGGGAASLTSIIILTWNQLSFTQACLASIAKHTPEPYELIVIDNFSSDGTVAWLRTQAALDSRIAVIENTVNRGFAAGCNQGISAANGDFILLLNNDTVVTEGWLSGMREPLERYPDAGIIGPMTNSASGVQVVPSIGYTSLDELDAFATSFRADYRYRIIPQRRVVGFCMLFSRKLVEKVGLLDESFGSGNFEDDDYCLRAELAGYRNLIVGDVFVHHFGGATFTGNQVDYSQAMMKNLLTFKKKWALENLEESTLRRWLVLSAIEKAQSLFQQGFIHEAVENLLQKGIRSDTTCGRPYIALAEMLISAGRYEEALQILPEMPMEVERSLVNEIESVCYAALGEDAASARAAHLATEKGINRARAWNVIGTLAVRQADVAGAEQCFQQSIAADPSCGAGWFSLGMLLWGKSDQKAAWHAISKAVLLEPLADEGVRIFCDMALRLGRMKEAIKLISEISRTYPDCRALALVKSEILANCDNVTEALESCETFLVRFGIDDSLLRVGCELRRNAPAFDRCADGEAESISLCMIVKNEENNISRCLASAKPVVHEIIVVDTGSTDRTVEIAELFGAKISSFPWNGNFSDARNSALSKAKGAWILVLDADEVLSAKDFSHIRQAVHESSGKKVTWSVLTRNYTHLHSQGWVANDGAYLAEERSNGWHPSWKVRLFPNDPDLHFVGGVHEMIEPTAQRFGYQVREASFVVHHYGGLADTAAGDRAKKETYYELGKQKLAERPDNLSAIVELAVQAAELELYEEAIKLWNRFLELAPDAAVALFNKGFALMRLNRFAEALDVTRRALEVESCHKEAAFNYGVCALYSGDPHEAIARLESILQKHTAHPPLLAILTLLYLISGQREKAAFTYSKLKSLNYAITDFAKARADVLLGLSKENLAKKLLDECAAIGMDVY